LGLFDSIFGKRHPVERGKECEDQFRTENEMFGDKIKRTGVGSDFEREKLSDPLTGKTRKEKWEIKRNNSPLSKRQKQTRGLKVARYRDNGFGGFEVSVENRKGEKLEKNLFTGKYEKVPKRQRGPFGLNNSTLCGESASSSRSKRHKSNDDLFGFNSNMFGNSSGKRKRKKQSDSFGWGF